MATGTALSNYAENYLLDYLFSGTKYVSLHTADPTDAGTGAEVSGGAYARASVTFAAAASGSKASNVAATFPAAAANWGTVTHVGIWDAATAGNLLMYGALAASSAINTGTTYSIPSGSLTASLD